MARRSSRHFHTSATARRVLCGLSLPIVTLVALSALGDGAALAAAAVAAALPVWPTPFFGAATPVGFRQPHASDFADVVEGALVGSTESAPTVLVLMLEAEDLPHILAKHGGGCAGRIHAVITERLASALRGDDRLVQIGQGLWGIALRTPADAAFAIAVDVAARCQAAVRKPVEVGKLRLDTTLGVGFCISSQVRDGSGRALVAAAEAALATARLCGPGAIRAHAPTLRQAEAAPRGASVADVAAALDAGQIRPWFQPQLDLTTGAVAGVEALARWEHPDRGPLPPAEFLPAITAGGLGPRLGAAILTQGLDALRDWRRRGLRVPTMGINLSSDELEDPLLARRIEWELHRFGITPQSLAIEILETVACVPENPAASRNIEALSALGCRIDLDDFGVGNASIGAIKRYRVDRIKIDRSFVRNLDEDADQAGLCGAIVDLADRLGVETLAEGVERMGEQLALRRLGCRYAQGYWIAPPAPMESMTEWLVLAQQSGTDGSRRLG